MNVAAMLAWYDEDPQILHRAITSAACTADTIIALDGRWDHYPGEHKASPREQYTAIREAAHQASLTLHLHTPSQARTWTGQVQKRNHMLMLALAAAADWVLPLDADWELQGHRPTIRDTLQQTTADALIVALHTPPNHQAPLEQVAATDWHAHLAGNTIHEPLIYRNLPGIRIERFHWCYSGLKDGHRVALWGQQPYPTARTEPIPALTIQHHCLHRDQRTIQANRAYCHQRDQHVAYHGQEP